MYPLVPLMNKSFEVTIITSNYFLPPDLKEILGKWKDDQTIKDYHFLPLFKSNNSELLNNILFIHCMVRLLIYKLNRVTFDIIISGSTVESWDRYIVEGLKTEKTKIVGIWSGGFPLPLHEYVISEFYHQYYKGERIEELHPQNYIHRNHKSQKSTTDIELPDSKYKIRDYLKRYIKTSKKFTLIRRLYGLPRHYFTKFYIILDRYVLPCLFTGRSFLIGKLDTITWFDTDHFDYIITFQKLQSRVFQSLFPKAEVVIAQHPNVHNCRCSIKIPVQKKILLCLSGYDGSDIQISLLLRDLVIVVSEIHPDEIHIRPHPRESHISLQKLVNYLENIGVKVKIDSTTQPIREIVCNYMGVIGIGSTTSLIEARFSCEYAIVIGLVAVAKTYAKNPKFTLGDVDGLEQTIDWIEEDGSYDPEIFKRKHHNPPDHPSIPDILHTIIHNST